MLLIAFSKDSTKGYCQSWVDAKGLTKLVGVKPIINSAIENSFL